MKKGVYSTDSKWFKRGGIQIKGTGIHTIKSKHYQTCSSEERTTADYCTPVPVLTIRLDIFVQTFFITMLYISGNAAPPPTKSTQQHYHSNL
jgi:hypothetical protein